VNVPAEVAHRGGCHCGRVRFEVRAPAQLTVTECNCSMCEKSGYLHLIVAGEQFTLLQGAAHLTEYTFNTSRRFQRQCALPGCRYRRRYDGKAIQWPAVGAELRGKTAGLSPPPTNDSGVRMASARLAANNRWRFAHR
jgi:hypothetical protein